MPPERPGWRRKSVTLLVAALVVLAGLPGCNTMRGIGEDISAFGRYLSHSTGTSAPHNSPPPQASPGF